MKSDTVKKKYWEMNPAELQEATKRYDREFVADEFHPMTAEDRALWAQMKHKGARRKSSVEKISVHVEKTLLERSDILAKRKGLTRDLLIDRALKTVLAADGQAV
ncbi:MAG TPA: hypothetical protein VKX17_03035 [Planctomycetota bacterium]|nr:hypothetical protein [Planctomycetota bacterium]